MEKFAVCIFLLVTPLLAQELTQQLTHNEERLNSSCGFRSGF